jgi:hypothetical protein
LSGGYSVTLIDDGLVLRPASDGPEIVLRPRHKWLKRNDGADLDTWTICNVFLGGAHPWNASCCLTSPDHLDIVLWA